MATFGAASGDNCAATAGFHANQEAMSALATNYGRLICAFHDKLPQDQTQINAELDVQTQVTVKPYFFPGLWISCRVLGRIGASILRQNDRVAQSTQLFNPDKKQRTTDPLGAKLPAGASAT